MLIFIFKSYVIKILNIFSKYIDEVKYIFVEHEQFNDNRSFNHYQYLLLQSCNLLSLIMLLCLRRVTLSVDFFYKDADDAQRPSIQIQIH